MQGSLNFEGKKYISAKDAAKQFGYTSDYIGQLCRGGKIKSKLVGRVWYVLESEISSYKKVHLAPGRPSKKNLSNKKTLHSSSFKKTKKIPDSKEDVLLENKKEIYLNLETPKESPKYNVFPEISRVAEIDSKKVLYIEDNSELFPTLKRNIDLEYIKRHAFDNLEKSKSGKYKATKFDKTVASSLVAVVVLSLGTFGLFEGSNFINRLKTESRGSAFEEVSLLYSPLVRDINRSVAQISEKTGVSSSQLALSVASDSNTKLVFDFVRNIGEKVFGRFFGKETVLVDSGESNTVKTIVIKETSYPSAAPAQNTVSTQAKTVFLPSFDKEYINSLIEEKFVALKNNFLTSTIAPNVNRYYVSRQNDEIVGNIGSVVANLEDRIDDAIANISLTDLNLSTLSVSGTSIFSGNVSLNGSTTASTLSATDWLSVGTTTNHATLTVDGAFYLAQVTPPGDTSNRLYNDGGDLYWNGSILAGSGVGNWSTDGTSVWRASGKVGIGTSTPSTSLVVQGNGLTYVNTNTNAGSSTISFGGGNNNRPVFNMGPLGTPDEFKIWNLGYYQMGATNSQGLALMTNNTNRLYITSAGNVGIGTTSPGSLLQIEGNPSGAILTLRRASTAGDLPIYFTKSNGGLQGAIVSYNAGDISLHTTDGAEKFRLLNNGNLGIGTTSPFAKLSVESTAGAAQFAIGSSTATSFIVDKNGNVGIGIVTPTQALDVVGSVQASGSFYSGNGIGISPTQTTMYSGYNFGWNANATRAGSPDVNLSRGGVSKLYLGNGTLGDFTGTLIAGNIGVATTSPSAKLSIKADGTGTGRAFTISDSADAEKLTVLDNGSLLLGTGSQLASSGKIRLTLGDGIRWRRNDLVNDMGITYDASGSFWYGTASSSSAPFLINSSGNIGVGISSPTSLLTLYGASQTITLQNPTTGSTVSDGYYLGLGAGTTDMYLWNRESGAVYFGQNNGTVMTLNNGNVGIGTTSPQNKLHLNTSASSQYIQLTTDSTGSLSTDGFQIGILNSGINASLWNLENGYMRFATNDQERMRIDSSGNVGIGTTTPVTKLTVYGTSADASALLDNGIFTVRGSNGAYLQIGSQTGEPYGLYLQGKDRTNNGTTYPILLNPVGGNVGVGTTTPWGKLSITNTGSGPSFIVEDSTSPDASPFVIDASGNVGVGTVAPEKALDVQVNSSGQTTLLQLKNNLGNTGVTADIDFSITSAANYAMARIGATRTNRGASLDTDITFSTRSNSVLSERMRIQDTGNVGIGSTSPFAKLSVESTVGAAQFVVGSSTATQFIVDKNGNVGVGTANPTSLLQIYGQGVDILQVGNGVDTNTSLNVQNRALFGYNQTRAAATIQGISGRGIDFNVNNNTFGSGQAMVITSAGNVGVGTTSPLGLLSVNANGLSLGAPQFVVGSSTATNFIVANNGNVGVGLTNPTQKMHVSGGNLQVDNGYIYANGAGNSIYSTGVIIARGGIANDSGAHLSIGGGTNNVTYFSANIGVGTTSPWGLLSINANGLSSGAPQFVVGSSTATNFIVTNDGNVGVGMTSPSYKLDVNGDIRYGANGTLRINGAGNFKLDSDELFFGGGSLGTIKTNWGGGGLSLIAGGNNQTSGDISLITNTASGDVTRLIVKSDGNVGIGTTSPYAKLSVVGDASITGNVRVAGLTATGTVVFSGITGSDQCLQVDANGVVGGTGSPCGSSSGGSAGGTWATTTSQVAGRFVNYSLNSTDLVAIGSNSTTTAEFWFDPNTSTSYLAGNVGIGVTSPGNKLHITGGGISVGNNTALTDRGLISVHDSSDARINITKAGVDGYRLETNGTAGSSYFTIGRDNGSSDTGSTNAFLNITQAGNVGVGSTTPMDKLTVVGGDISLSRNQYLRFRSESSSIQSAAIGGTSSNDLAFYTNGLAEGMRLTSSGYLGIASTSPWGLLSINPNGLSSGAPQFVIGSSTATSFIVANNGNVGVGTTSFSPSAKLQVSGGNIVTDSRFQINNGTARVEVKYGGSVGSIGSVQNEDFAIITGDTNQRLYIKSSTGNVGVGTTSPWAQLSVHRNTSDTSYSPLFAVASSTASGTTTNFIVANNGNVGIGTVAPGEKLSVNGNIQIPSGNALRLTIVAGSPQIYSDGANIVLSTQSGSTVNVPNGTLTVSGTGNSSFAGNVGIGTTTPNRKLTVFSDSTVGQSQLRIGFSDQFSWDIGRDNGSSDGRLMFTSNHNGTTAERMSILSNTGNVGIGTTTPGNKLDVFGSANVSGALGIGSVFTPSFYLDVQAPSVNAQFKSTTATNNAYFKVTNTTNSLFFGAESSVGGTLGVGTLPYAGVLNSTLKELQLAANNNVAMTILTTGNVGIGTTSPTSRLQVAGTSIGVGNETGILAVVDSADNSRRLLFGIDNTLGTNGTAFISGVKQGVAWLPLLLNPSGGNVGIGTTTPSSLFTVHGSGLPQVLINGTAGDSRIQLANLGVASAQIAYDNSSGRGLNISTLSTAGQKNLFFQTSGSDRMMIDSVGNVGVGTTTPWGLLSVNANGLSSGAPQFVVGSSTATNFIVANNGNVGVGTASPSHKLTLASGNFAVETGNMYLASGNSIHFDYGSSNNYYIQKNGTNLYLGTGGSFAMMNGNVGIGTTTPAATLTVTKSGATGNIFAIASSSGENYFTVAQHGSYGSTSQVTVKGVASFNNDFDQAATVALKNTNTGTSVAAGYTVSAGNDFTNLGIFTAYSTAYDNPPGYERAGRVFMGHSIGSGGLTLIGGSDIRFNVGGTSLAEERMRLTSDGKLGIGTTSPTNALGVVGSIDTTSTYRINNTIRMLASTNYTELADGSGNSRLHLGNATDPTNYYSNNTHVFRNGAASTEYGRFTSSGYLGVGTSTPWAQLSVHRNTSNTSNAPLFVVASSTASATTTNFIVTSNGNVGIGTSAPGFPLQVNGNAMIGATVPTYIPAAPLNLVNSAGGNMKTQLSLVNTGGGAGAGSAIDFFTYDLSGGTNPGLRLAAYDNSYSADFAILTKVPGNEGNAITEKFRLTNTGLVGIGTTSPTATLTVQGTSTAPTIDSFVVASSSGSTMFRIDNRGNMLHGGGSINSSASGAMAIGNNASISSSGGDNSAIGYGASITQGYRNLAMHGATITGNSAFSMAIGTGASVPNDGTTYAIAIGAGDTSGSVSTAIAGASNSVAIGNYITTSATGAYIFGSGPTGASRLVNNVANSIMFGTNTTAPTLFVGPGRTTTTAGTVAVGTTTTSATFALQGASGFDILSVATSTSGKILTISSWGGFVQNISSSTAINIQNGSGASVFTVDTTGTAANSGIDITAGSGQTGNLVNLYSSGGTYLSGFTAAGGMLMNISSTTAIDIQNGSNVSVFAVDTTNKWLKISTSTSPTFTTDGQFTIGSAGTAASDGRIWIRSGATTFRFQSTNNTADYSEFFYQLEPSEVGDVLSLAQKEYIEENTNASTTLPKDTGVVKKSSGGYDERLLGVYTARGTSFNNPDDNRQKDPNFANVGLLGHVATKVTNENGEIRVGDYITSSEKFPGYGMKATKSGQILGVAVEDFGSATTTETQLEGETYELSKVMVMVSPRYQAITENVLVEVNNGETLSGDEIQNQTPLVLHNQNDSGPIMQLQAAGQTRLLVANNGAVKMFTQETDSKGIVFEINNNGGSVFSINSVGDAKVAGAIYIESDSFAGSIATNDMGLADIDFANNLGTGKPVIQLTPEGDVPTIAQVASWKKDLAGNYIGLVIKTFGTEGQAVTANVHYAVFGKREGYETTNGIPILTNTTDPDQEEPELVLPEGDGVTGGNATTTASSTPDGDNATSTPDGSGDVGDGATTTPTSG